MASLETCVLWNYFNTIYSYRNWTWRSNSWVYYNRHNWITCNVFTDPSINFILRCLTLVLYSSMSWKQRKSLLPIWTCTIETLRLKDENNYEYEIWFIAFSYIQLALEPRWPGHYFCHFEKCLPQPEIKGTCQIHIHLEIHFNIVLHSIFYILQSTFVQSIPFLILWYYFVIFG